MWLFLKKIILVQQELLLNFLGQLRLFISSLRIGSLVLVAWWNIQIVLEFLDLRFSMLNSSVFQPGQKKEEKKKKTMNKSITRATTTASVPCTSLVPWEFNNIRYIQYGPRDVSFYVHRHEIQSRLHNYWKLFKVRTRAQCLTTEASGFMSWFRDRRARWNTSWTFWWPLDRDGNPCSILNNFVGEPGSGLSLCTNKCLFLDSLATSPSLLPLAGNSNMVR